LSQVFYSILSERLLVEQIDYNLLFRWFVGLGMDDATWNRAVFSKNRDWLPTSDAARQFFAEAIPRAKKFMSDERFTVDGTLIQAWASRKSFHAEDGSDNGDGANYHSRKRSNKTHESTADSDPRPYKKSGLEYHLGAWAAGALGYTRPGNCIAHVLLGDAQLLQVRPDLFHPVPL
jgi:hypothetical protein